MHFREFHLCDGASELTCTSWKMHSEGKEYIHALSSGYLFIVCCQEVLQWNIEAWRQGPTAPHKFHQRQESTAWCKRHVNQWR
jgi:hypothetical protein